MKRPQGARMAAGVQEGAPPARQERRVHRWDPWLGWQGVFWSSGLQLFDAWLQLCEQVWGSGLAPSGRRGPRGTSHDRRRPSDMPWVPRLEATVIPLRRQTDPPGAEATRLSMRLPMPPMPWSGGAANVISVEAIVGARGRREPAAHSKEREAPSPPSPDEER